jgi:hypothetical protein
VASKLRLPAVVLLLPVGFAAGHFITVMNTQKSLGSWLKSPPTLKPLSTSSPARPAHLTPAIVTCVLSESR